jgi:hypothetical protein
VIRIGDNKIPVHRGSYIAMPVGPRHAHQLWNTSESETLRYLCYSTNVWSNTSFYLHITYLVSVHALFYVNTMRVCVTTHCTGWLTGAVVRGIELP